MCKQSLGTAADLPHLPPPFLSRIPLWRSHGLGNGMPLREGDHAGFFVKARVYCQQSSMGEQLPQLRNVWVGPISEGEGCRLRWEGNLLLALPQHMRDTEHLGCRLV